MWSFIALMLFVKLRLCEILDTIIYISLCLRRATEEMSLKGKASPKLYPITSNGLKRSGRFSRPALFCQPALWWWRLSLLSRCSFTFATIEGGNLPVYLPRRVNGLVGRWMPGNRTQVARLRVLHLNHYATLHSLH